MSYKNKMSNVLDLQTLETGNLSTANKLYSTNSYFGCPNNTIASTVSIMAC
ncbi:hypothetical protein LAE98_30635 [Bacillus wiedmannii]|nr:hypothetical protein [Bacillus wiedmannii]